MNECPQVTIIKQKEYIAELERKLNKMKEENKKLLLRIKSS